MFKMIQIILLFLIFINLNATVFAGDNIPSTQEVQYAKEVYLLMTTFDAKETKFAEGANSETPTTNNQMKDIFKNKFDYTKTYYLTLKSKQPTSKFMASHQALLNGLYQTLQYIQLVIVELDKKKNVNEITAQHSQVFLKANDVYSKAVKEFIAIVRSWQRPYIDKVMPQKQAN